MRPNEGYAKLKGYDFDFYMQKLMATIGRKTPHSKGADINLDHKNVSRKHAKIQYNFKNRCFELVCYGKNGVKVDGKFFGPKESNIRLANGSEIQIGDSSFIFLLPTRKTPPPTSTNATITAPVTYVAKPKDQMRARVVVPVTAPLYHYNNNNNNIEAKEDSANGIAASASPTETTKTAATVKPSVTASTTTSTKAAPEATDSTTTATLPPASAKPVSAPTGNGAAATATISATEGACTSSSSSSAAPAKQAQVPPLSLDAAAIGLIHEADLRNGRSYSPDDIDIDIDLDLDTDIDDAKMQDIIDDFILESPSGDIFLAHSDDSNHSSSSSSKGNNDNTTTTTNTTENTSISAEKPNYSYATMIAQALSSQPDKRLTLKEIYQWIMDTYPYFRNSEIGWRSSVRHNLSSSKFFHKVPQDDVKNPKRALYELNPEYESKLLQGVSGGGGGGRKQSKAAKDKSTDDAGETTSPTKKQLRKQQKRKSSTKKPEDDDDDDGDDGDDLNLDPTTTTSTTTSSTSTSSQQLESSSPPNLYETLKKDIIPVIALSTDLAPSTNLLDSPHLGGLSTIVNNDSLSYILASSSTPQSSPALVPQQFYFLNSDMADNHFDVEDLLDDGPLHKRYRLDSNFDQSQDSLLGSPSLNGMGML